MVFDEIIICCWSLPKLKKGDLSTMHLGLLGCLGQSLAQIDQCILKLGWWICHLHAAEINYLVDLLIAAKEADLMWHEV